MIEFGKGNLLNADVVALVNRATTVGMMGKGVALQFNGPSQLAKRKMV